jgi:bifunctional DNA-binding transcriptional regulator/antitoxin component of YhaV-PrlF toxin-antitoxin module
MVRKVKPEGGRTRRPSRISAKNQVTLPVSALDDAGMHQGTAVVIEASGPGRIVVTAVEDEFDAFLGSLPGVWPKDALESLRDEWR